MAFAQDHKDIRTYFRANWADTHLVIYDNQPEVEAPEDEIWCRLSVQSGASKPQTIGTAITYLQIGRIYFDIFAPRATGVVTAMTLADEFAQLFRNKYAGNVRFLSPEIRQFDEPDDNRYRVQVTLPWESYRT